MPKYSIDGEEEPQKSSEASGHKVAFCSGAEDSDAGLSHEVLRANEVERFEAELDNLLSDDEVEHRADAGEAATSGLSKRLRELVKTKIKAIEADNLAKKEERNDRRRAARRASLEYQLELKEAREAYANKIAAEEGREVRGYEKVPGKTAEERAENAKAREADRERERRANADQATKERQADKKYVKRKKAAGWSDEQIEEGLALLHEQRAADRLHRQPDPGKYEDNPKFGAF
ncbi:hypothetical protein XM53_18305 [Roseovarius atlanticus]|uniref:Uncharacterized protein n=1 Tax=Roseovarius atlanticus TaxID=1641875 RepID=A0A0T5NPZ8_9RHOB|nr:hypothetical protein [Roseovarius atlanticus]KRS11032.1 hypothetical protein XM53_18305 [Roseovarius atlanticus]